MVRNLQAVAMRYVMGRKRVDFILDCKRIR